MNAELPSSKASTTTTATTTTAATTTAMSLDGLVTSLDQLLKNGTVAKEYKKLPTSPLFSCKEGKSPQVAKKNRNKTVLPYDHNRVILSQVKSSLLDDDKDYINASFIRGFTNEDGFIATQGPMLGTVDDFWSMVWSENSKLIVMLCRLVERCQNQSYKYWPDVGDCLEVDDVTISTDYEDERGAYVMRKCSLRHNKTGERREVVHFQSSFWPDNSLPCLPTFVSFWKTFCKYKPMSCGPPIIHCSDGSQRTGLLIALVNLVRQWEMTSSIDVFSCCMRLREDRVGFLGCESEYVFLYRAVVEAYLSRATTRQADVLASFANDIDVNTDASAAEDLVVRGQLLETVLKEFKVLERQRQEPTNVNDNSQNTFFFGNDPEEHIYRQQFPPDTGSVYITYVPLSYQRVSGMETRPARLRHSVSLQESEMILGISGVVPSECKCSFLVTATPTQQQSIDFWQMMFDTECRTIVRLVSSQEQMSTKCDKLPIHTPDFSVSLTSQRLMKGLVNETVLSLNSDVTPVIPLDIEVFPETPIKMFTIVWSCDSQVTRSYEALFTLQRLVRDWLHQSSSTLVTLQCRDGWSESSHFCASFNAVSALSIDDCVDIYLIARTVQDRIPRAITQDEYKHVYSACVHFLRQWHQKLQQVDSNMSSISMTDHQPLCEMVSCSSTDD